MNVCLSSEEECYNFPLPATHAGTSQWINSQSFSHEGSKNEREGDTEEKRRMRPTSPNAKTKAPPPPKCHRISVQSRIVRSAAVAATHQEIFSEGRREDGGRREATRQNGIVSQ